MIKNKHSNHSKPTLYHNQPIANQNSPPNHKQKSPQPSQSHLISHEIIHHQHQN